MTNFRDEKRKLDLKKLCIKFSSQKKKIRAERKKVTSGAKPKILQLEPARLGIITSFHALKFGGTNSIPR